MSEIEIKQMQEKINAGILLARKRLIEKTKKEDGELVVVRDGKVVRIKAKDLKETIRSTLANQAYAVGAYER